MSDLVLRREPEALVADARGWLADLRADPDDIRRLMRAGAVVEAMQMAAKRAGESEEMELAYAEAARHADRRLGQLLTEGRANGVFAQQAQGRGKTVDAPTVSQLGIDKNHAADAVWFAAPEDDEWITIIDEARSEANLSRASIRRLTKAIAEMSDEELALRKRLMNGETIVVSYRGDGHQHLITFAEFHDLVVRIDRRSSWGNPFEMPDDGDRATVIASFEHHYLPHKPALLDRMPELRGKALACWCAPEPCHGDVLKRLAES